MIVACVKQGDEFSRQYVYRLRDSVKEHLSKDYRFICLTDDTDLGCETVPLVPSLKGWWGKMQLFTLPGRVLYFDLDTMIVGDIDFLTDYDGPLAVLSGAWQPHRIGSGIMSFAGQQGIWDRFIDHPGWWMRYCGNQGDGMAIQLIHGYADRLDQLYPGKLASYKRDVRENGVQPGVSVVYFHGRPRPHEIDWTLP